MDIRIGAKDVESAKLLVCGLVGLFGSEGVSLRADGDVHVELNGESGKQEMVQTLGSVERWLEKTGIGSTDVWVGERQYTMERPVARSGPPSLLR